MHLVTYRKTHASGNQQTNITVMMALRIPCGSQALTIILSPLAPATGLGETVLILVEELPGSPGKLAVGLLLFSVAFL